jgi:anti-sigma factor RsiW
MNRGCEFHADALIERAAGALDEARGEHLDAHLAECPECAASLETIAALQAAPLEIPAGLQPRIRAAVAEAARPGIRTTEAAEAAAPGAPRRRARAHWRPWAVPLAAAAALVVLWIGVGLPDGNGTLADASLAVFEDYDPYGAWPAEGLIIAGEPLLSELSVAELERLLEEMES